METPDDPNRAFIHPGMGERPMHACSCSKAIAAFADEAFMEKFLAGTLKAYTQHTKTTREMLMVEFELIRNQDMQTVTKKLMWVSRVSLHQ